MIDPRIPLMGQQQADPFESAAKGIQFGQGLRQLLSGRQAGKMAALNPEERQAFANKSMFSRELNAQLKADAAAQEKAMYDRLKTEAEISKIGSEAYKNNQQGGGYALDNSGKTQAAIESVIQQAAMTGDPGQVKIGLGRLAKTGLITPEQYQQEVAIIELMKPEELLKYAQGSALTNKEVAPYIYQTANNVADNKVTERGQTLNYNLGKDKLEQDQQQFEAKQAYDAYLLKNKPVNTFTDINGYRRHEFADGSSMVVRDENGQPVKAQQAGAMNSTIQGAILDTDDKVSSTKNAITNLKDALKYSEKAYDGIGAAQRATARGLFGEDERATATTMLDNIVTGNALEMLKSTFGAAPTEGERAILLQLQGSANLPRAQREAIYTRAIQMAEARLASNQQKAADLRSGTYFSQQQGIPYANAGQQPPQSTFNLFD